VVRAAPRTAPTLVTIVIGVVAWAVFAMFLHLPLIGVRPLG
jgi:hypothetical protein